MGALTIRQHTTHEISGTIGTKARRLIPRRTKIRTRNVGQVMFNIVLTKAKLAGRNFQSRSQLGTEVQLVDLFSSYMYYWDVK